MVSVSLDHRTHVGNVSCLVREQPVLIHHHDAEPVVYIQHRSLWRVVRSAAPVAANGPGSLSTEEVDALGHGHADHREGVVVAEAPHLEVLVVQEEAVVRIVPQRTEAVRLLDRVDRAPAALPQVDGGMHGVDDRLRARPELHWPRREAGNCRGRAALRHVHQPRGRHRGLRAVWCDQAEADAHLSGGTSGVGDLSRGAHVGGGAAVQRRGQVRRSEEAILGHMDGAGLDKLDVPVQAASFVPPATALLTPALVPVVRVHEHSNHIGPAELDIRDVVKAQSERGVAAIMVGGCFPVDPHRGRTKRALEVQPHSGASPLCGEREALPVPQHVPRDVRLARAPGRARGLGGCRGDETVVGQLNVLPIRVTVGRLGLGWARPGVGGHWRLGVRWVGRVQPSAVLPSEVEGDDLPRGRVREAQQGHGQDWTPHGRWVRAARGRVS
mmetsp:Transcript_42300/g.121529  ORF Transcript_42300/g.121529 Transcript_42300/m.121529 type:complete len:441 (-) Transcript_42300:43-1365(-)